MKKVCVLFFALLVVIGAKGGSIEDIRKALEQGSQSQVQEKVYVHTDNTCYFVGDTLWYKAYVVRADNMHPTDMSRILYVELLSPDGLLVERQQVVVSATGYACGQFALRDSLYSGYYELRAYTRWMLNFNVRQHRYSEHDTWHFYNKQMAADYFRIWDGLYSRVLPVYSKPDEAGNYDARRMYQRPKTRLPKIKKDNLVVTFYPEGGHLIQGVENRVAFDVVDQHGEAVNIHGTVDVGGRTQDVKTEYMGRGSFLITPSDKHPKARFTFRGKDYAVNLPNPEAQGVAVRLDGDRLTISSMGLPSDKEYGLSVLSGGTLRWFTSLPRASSISRNTSNTSDTSETRTISIPVDSLPTGVNDLTIFDSDGRIWADRLFFVNHHDCEKGLISSTIESTHTYAPYERIEVPVQLPVTVPTTFSLSIHDTYTDEPSYDDGNLMTSMLLSSELLGFIARPAYYFEKDDEQHRRHLDLLMMVQGWRKYKWQELSDTARQLRYTPEQNFTVEGSVYKMLSVGETTIDEFPLWKYGVGFSRLRVPGEELIGTEERVNLMFPSNDSVYDYIRNLDEGLGVDNKPLQREVLVEAEIIAGKDVAGGVQKIQNGRFMFNIPPFYGGGYLNIKAYKEKDAEKKGMEKRKDVKAMNEDAYPDYYVKRDLFYPAFTRDYDYYEKHQPEYTGDPMVDTLSEFSMENDIHELANVNVKGRRRGRRAIDWNKPAYVLDAYDIYNELTDRGLSFGKLDMRQFPVQVSYYLFGNLNRANSVRVDGRIDGKTFYRNYLPMEPLNKFASPSEVDAFESKKASFDLMRSPQSIMEALRLKRLQDVRVFTDYDTRTEDSTMVEEQYVADVTVEMVPFPDHAVQPSMRDRHIYLMGFSYPESFYQPDYSSRTVGDDVADYRRTLYWNPNAKCDETGHFTASFYNNGKDTRIKMTAAGVTSDGRLLYTK